MQSAEQQQTELARVAAQTGWARAKQALAQSFAAGSISGTTDGTDYQTTTVVSGDRATVTSVGRRARTGRTGETTYTVVYTLRRNASGLSPRPRFMRYAVVAGGDVSFSGSSDVVELGVTDATRDTTTLTVHANGRLSAGGSSVVQGFGTYTGGAASGIETNFRPLHNPLGLATVRPSERIEIPIVDPDAMVARDRLDYSYPAGTSLSGTLLPGGPREAPKVYRFRGAASFTNVRVVGYAVFIVDGNVSVSGTVQGDALGYTGPQESPLAIYTPGTLSMGGNARLYAQVVANAGLSYNGNARIYGSVVVNGNYSQGGTATLHYRPASAALTQGFTGRLGPGFTLLAVREQ